MRKVLAALVVVIALVIFGILFFGNTGGDPLSSETSLVESVEEQPIEVIETEIDEVISETEIDEVISENIQVKVENGSYFIDEREISLSELTQEAAGHEVMIITGSTAREMDVSECTSALIEAGISHSLLTGTEN